MVKNINISVVILGKNSADRLENIYKNIRKSEDIILVDDNSSDNTKSVCKILGIRYVKRALNGDFSAQRNFALNLCVNDWVLFLDSDEMVGECLLDEAQTKIASGKYHAFNIRRVNNFLEHKMFGTEMGRQMIIRLADKKRGKWLRKVHEYWKIEGNIGTLETQIIHNTAYDINGFIRKILLYFPIHANENKCLGKAPSFYKLLLYPILKFIKNFVFLGGVKDGVCGYIVSVFMSFHSFLSWSEAWLIKRNSYEGN